jgi:hypothetical protein
MGSPAIPLRLAIDLAIDAILQEAGKSEIGAIRRLEVSLIAAEAEPEPLIPKSL